MTMLVPLSRGYEALVDDADYAHVVAVGKWSASVKPNTVYALRGVRRAGSGWTTTRLHNFITGWSFVDHINGNGLDNRRSNLRPATKRQNAQNSVVRRVRSSSGLKGVTWHQAANKWLSQIVGPEGRIYLGVYKDPVLAARVYDRAALDLFGEFARINFPDDHSPLT